MRWVSRWSVVTIAACVIAAASAPDSISAAESKVSCDPTAGVVRVVGHASDYVTVGYRSDDNALWVDDSMAINNHGGVRHDRRTCPNPDATWNRIELDLGSGKDTTDPSGDSPEFEAVPAEAEMLIKGGRQIDELYGHNGPDEIIGGRGRDYLLGRDGDDRLVGGVGDDEIVGFAGNDHVEAADGIKDQILCGKGDDMAVVDSEDRPKDCETVKVRPRPPARLASPRGAVNDFGCRSASHPRPVVLVHGTFLNSALDWPVVAPALERQGYCVFALDYGNLGTGDIPTSAERLKEFVDRVLAATGARKVSIVGHSQGGMMPRYYAKFLGGAKRIADLIGLAPSNHGTTTPLAPLVAGACPACGQQVAGSAFLNELNAGDETPGKISYTVVETRYDEVVTPYPSAFLAPGPRTTNVLLQDDCPADLSEHIAISYDHVALQWIENALGRKGPADPGFRPSC
jgi:triacylglycerol lipase